MLIQVLKSKLKDVIVTAADTNYEGSITLCPLLMSAADLQQYERVEVNGVNSDSRIVTYVIEGTKLGQVELNGGAANLFIKGEHIHVNCFALAEEKDFLMGPVPLMSQFPKIVKTDENNKVI